MSSALLVLAARAAVAVPIESSSGPTGPTVTIAPGVDMP